MTNNSLFEGDVQKLNLAVSNKVNMRLPIFAILFDNYTPLETV